MVKPMDSGRGLGAKRSDTRRYREHLQRRHRPEDAVSRFDISGLAYQGLPVYTFSRRIGPICESIGRDPACCRIVA